MTTAAILQAPPALPDELQWSQTLGMLLFYIVLFDLIRESDLIVFTVTNDIRRMSCWQPTMQVIVVWNALWRVLQWYHILTYINYECRKYLVHLVLLYIKKLMVCLFEFLRVPRLCFQRIDLTHAMLLCCLIHFRFLKGMLWLRTLALVIFASYW